MENELLYNELYEKTQDCGRAQFVRLLMEKERENRELKQQLKQKENIINRVREWTDNHDIDDCWELLEILDNKGE